MRVRFYVRASTQEQADSRLGLEAQAAALSRVGSERGWEGCELYEDAGVSGGSLKRPRLEDLLLDLSKGEALAVAKLDRLSRSIHDFSGLVQRARIEGWHIICLDPEIDLSTPNGRLVANVLASVSEWERDIIGQRTREAMAQRVASGLLVGRPIQVPPEVEERICMERRRGRSYGAIIDGLHNDGILTPKGKEWRLSSIQRILQRNDLVKPRAIREAMEG